MDKANDAFHQKHIKEREVFEDFREIGIREEEELSGLRALLDEIDPEQKWRNELTKIKTPQGHYLWLCKEHADKYRK